MARQMSMLDHVTNIILSENDLSDPQALDLMNRLENLVTKSLPEIKKQWFELKSEIQSNVESNLTPKETSNPAVSASAVSRGIQAMPPSLRKPSRMGVFSGSGKKKELIQKLIERQKQRTKTLMAASSEFLSQSKDEIPTVDVEVKKSHSGRDSRHLSPILQQKKG